MKKFFTSFCIFAASLGMVNAQQSVNLNWSSALTVGSASGKPQTTICGMTKDAQNNVYTFAQYGSHSTSPADGTTANFLGETFTGSPYSVNTSYCMNMLLIKHDFEGKVIWKVYTNGGDVNVTSSTMTPTSDGGAILALKCHHSDKNAWSDDNEQKNVILNIVGSDNKATNLKFVYPGDEYHWTYVPVLVKINADGTIAKAIQMGVDYSPAPEATTYSWGTPEGFYFDNACCDDNGNIYICGRQTRDLYVYSSDNVKNTIPCHNVSTWNGDSQGNVGNGYIIKLNSDLSYNSHLVTEGEGIYEHFRSMEYDNGNIYLYGIMKGDGVNPSVKLGEKDIELSGNYDMFTAKIKADNLTTEWAKSIPGVKAANKNFFYGNPGFTLSPDKADLYIASAIQGSFSVNGEEMPCKNASYNKYLVRVDASNGEAKAGKLIDVAGIANYSGSIECTNDSVYALGYDWSNGLKYKFTYDSYDRNLNEGFQYGLATTPQMGTSLCSVANDKTVIVGLRNRGGYDLTFVDGDETKTYTNPTQWYGLIASFNINTKSSGVATAINDNSNLKIWGGNGTINISTDKAQTINIYNIAGTLVRSVKVVEGNTTIDLEAGIYIANRTKVIVK